MTELSPVGTYNAPKPAQVALSRQDFQRHALKQGRILSGIDMKIVDGNAKELPWDGVAFGDLMVRGPWIASAYYGDPPGSALPDSLIVAKIAQAMERSWRAVGKSDVADKFKGYDWKTEEDAFLDGYNKHADGGQYRRWQLRAASAT